MYLFPLEKNTELLLMRLSAGKNGCLQAMNKYAQLHAKKQNSEKIIKTVICKL